MTTHTNAEALALRLDAEQVDTVQPVEQPTRSQKMRAAGHARRPQGWGKDGDEPVEQPSVEQQELDELREKVAALETSMPPALEFAHVGTVQHLEELNDAWLAKLPIGEKLYTHAQPVEQLSVDAVEWAVGKWIAEVQNRPLVNVHRRSLDDTWRTVIRHFGGDDTKLLPLKRHDYLVMADNENSRAIEQAIKGAK